MPAAAVALPRCPPVRAPRCFRALAGRHRIVTEGSPARRLNLLSLPRNSIALTSTSLSSRTSVNPRAPNPDCTVASPSQLRPRSASLWAATTKHSAPPSTPVATSPCPTNTRQPLDAPQFWSEASYRRSTAAAASASPWNPIFRPPLTPIDPFLSFLTSPGSFSTFPPHP
jgi:hypothetical protein